MRCSKAPKIDFAVTDEQLTGTAGLASVATLASWIDLPCQLARPVRVKRRRPVEQMLMSLICSFCAGGSHLSDADSLAGDRAPLLGNGERLPVPRYSFILVSRNARPLAASGIRSRTERCRSMQNVSGSVLGRTATVPSHWKFSFRLRSAPKSADPAPTAKFQPQATLDFPRHESQGVRNLVEG